MDVHGLHVDLPTSHLCARNFRLPAYLALIDLQHHGDRHVSLACSFFSLFSVDFVLACSGVRGRVVVGMISVFSRA